MKLNLFLKIFLSVIVVISLSVVGYSIGWRKADNNRVQEINKLQNQLVKEKKENQNLSQSKKDLEKHAMSSEDQIDSFQKPTKIDEDEIDTSDWEVYRNEDIGVNFKYPASWGEVKFNIDTNNYKLLGFSENNFFNLVFAYSDFCWGELQFYGLPLGDVLVPHCDKSTFIEMTQSLDCEKDKVDKSNLILNCIKGKLDKSNFPYTTFYSVNQSAIDPDFYYLTHEAKVIFDCSDFKKLKVVHQLAEFNYGMQDKTVNKDFNNFVNNISCIQ